MAIADDLRDAGLPSTSEPRISELSAHDDVRVRVLCAAHPAASETTIARLAIDRATAVRRRLAHRPALPTDVVDVLLRDDDLKVRRGILARNEITIEQLVAAVRLGQWDPRVAEAITARLQDPAVAARVIEDEQLRFFAASGAFDDATIRSRFTQWPLNIQAAVAGRASLSQRSIRRIARSKDRNVAQAIMRRADVSPTTTCAVMVRGSAWAAAEALRRPDASRWLLRLSRVRHAHAVDRERARVETYRIGRWLLSRHRGWDVRAAVASNPRSRWVLRKLVRDDSWAVLDAMAHRDDLPDRLIRRMGGHAAVRLTFADNPATPEHFVRALLQDFNPYVRGQARGNPNAPLDLVRASAADPSLTAWELRRITEHPGLDDETRDRVLTWLALGGGVGDVSFDPVTCRGTPGAIGASHDQAYADEASISELHSPLWRSRAAYGSGQTTLSQDDLRAMSRDAAPAVRAVAANYSPHGGLHVLQYDEQPFVAARAARSMAGPSMQRQKRSNRKVILRRLGWFGVASVLIFAVNRLNDPNDSSSSPPIGAGLNQQIVVRWQAVDLPTDAPLCVRNGVSVWASPMQVGVRVTLLADTTSTFMAQAHANNTAGERLEQEVVAGKPTALLAVFPGEGSVTFVSNSLSQRLVIERTSGATPTITLQGPC